MDPIVISLLTAILGVFCGAAASSYFNLRSARKDMLFKRKLEYFERLSQDLEENLRLHKKVVLSLSLKSKKDEMEKSLAELKQNRKTFLVRASPLYFDTAKMSEKILAFVEIEKQIFNIMENLIKNNKNSASRKRNLFELNERLPKLSNCEEEIISEMKIELHSKWNADKILKANLLNSQR